MKVLHRQLLVAGVFLLTLIAIGIIGLFSLKSTVHGLETVYQDRVVPLRDLKSIADMYAVNIVDTTHKTRNGNHPPAKALEDIAAAEETVEKLWKAYLATFLVDEEKRLVAQIEPLMAKGNAAVARLKDILRRGASDELARFAANDLYPAIDPISEKFSELIEVQLKVAEQEYLLGESRYAFNRNLIIVAMILAAALGGLLALRMARQLVAELGGEPGDVAAAVGRIAVGDLRSEVVVRDGDTSSLAYSLKLMQASLRGIVSEIGNMVEAAAQRGDFGVQMNLAGKQGFMKDLSERLNQLSTVTDTGLRDVMRVAKALADGDLSQKIDAQYPGLFGAAAEGVNRTVESLNKIVTEVRELVDAAANRGDFSRRIDLAGKAGYNLTLGQLLNRLSEVTDDGLKEIRRVAQALASGDLTQRIDREFPGVFGQTTGAINDTVDNLENLVAAIKTAVEAINTAAQEIAAGNQDLSSRTEEQASSLEETASSMEELTGTVKMNAENSENANRLANEAQGVAAKGGAVVGQVVETMAAVRESSNRIADIISVIDGIAFQTNILALNAAVEAARAGEQGRGFAVVATEVRNLAQRSSAAAKDIKTLISDSVTKVQEGNRMVEAAGQTMEEVVGSIQRVAAIVSDISSASREQSTGIEQVSHAVAQMDEVTQQNAALVEQAAAAAESLEEQASQLARAVAAFRIAGHAAPALSAPAPKLPPPARAAQPKLEKPRLELPAALTVGDDDGTWAEF